MNDNTPKLYDEAAELLQLITDEANKRKKGERLYPYDQSDLLNQAVFYLALSAYPDIFKAVNEKYTEKSQAEQ